MHLQLMHESLSRFSESFASFLYGLNMNAFCVDFPEVRLQPRDCYPAHNVDSFRLQYRTLSRGLHSWTSILVSSARLTLCRTN